MAAKKKTESKKEEQNQDVAPDGGETMQHNTVNEDLSEATVNDAGFVDASREDVVGDPVVSNNLEEAYGDVEEGPYGDVYDETAHGKRSERQKQAAQAVENYEKQKRERRGL